MIDTKNQKKDRDGKKKQYRKNKDGKTIILYTNDAKEQHSFVKTATDKGYEVLELGGPLISHLISKLESDSSEVQFTRVDADIIDKLIEKVPYSQVVDHL